MAPEPLPEPVLPIWAEGLATVFEELDAVDVVPRVNVVP